jgi:hypothetical protein
MPKGKKTTAIREPPKKMLVRIDGYNVLQDKICNLENQLRRAQSDWAIEKAAHNSTITQRQGFRDLAKQTGDQYEGYRKSVEDVLRVIYGKPPVIIERR